MPHPGSVKSETEVTGKVGEVREAEDKGEGGLFGEEGSG